MRQTYTVTIRQEGSDYIARDKNGTWRTRGSADTSPGLNGRKLAEYLFHAEEIARVTLATDGSTVAEIFEF